jgi:hypothetical protein
LFWFRLQFVETPVIISLPVLRDRAMLSATLSKKLI